MKKLSIYSAVLAAVLCSIGCEKNEIKYGDFDRVSPDQALLKVNLATPYATNPTMYIGLDGNRVSNPITSRTPFPGGGYNTGGGSTADYLALTPGKHTIKIAIPTKKTEDLGKDSIILFTTEVTLQAGKNQSLHIADTGTNTQALMLLDDVSKPDTGSIRYNFVNLIPNVESLDLYLGSTLLAAGIPYKGNKVFTIKTPTDASTWYIRVGGSSPTSAALAPYATGSTIANRRVYTIFASGYKDLTDTRKPYVSFYLNW